MVDRHGAVILKMNEKVFGNTYSTSKDNDKPHPKSRNEFLDLNPCPSPLNQCMHATGYMQGILSLSWNDCYLLFYNIFATPDKLTAVVKRDKFFLQNINSRYSVHFLISESYKV